MHETSTFLSFFTFLPRPVSHSPSGTLEGRNNGGVRKVRKERKKKDIENAWLAHRRSFPGHGKEVPKEAPSSGIGYVFRVLFLVSRDVFVMHVHFRAPAIRLSLEAADRF